VRAHSCGAALGPQLEKQRLESRIRVLQKGFLAEHSGQGVAGSEMCWTHLDPTSSHHPCPAFQQGQRLLVQLGSTFFTSVSYMSKEKNARRTYPRSMWRPHCAAKRLPAGRHSQKMRHPTSKIAEADRISSTTSLRHPTHSSES
jgi:hypothetical protein